MEFVLIWKWLSPTLINVTERWYEYLGISLDRFLMIGIFLCFVFVPTSFFLSGWASNRFIKMEKKIFKRQQTHLWGSKHNYHFRFFLKVKIYLLSTTLHTKILLWWQHFLKSNENSIKVPGIFVLTRSDVQFIQPEISSQFSTFFHFLWNNIF